ncbi:DNA adenine methylase, partial [Nocardia sp. NPDC058497]|uniref:DNA adenine methylase n=1 Tax=Nocardia sp. NPDC058497 TaxID=3346529 RepID=UPI0036548D0E
MRSLDHAEPILRWAGGKRWLIPAIRTIIRDTVTRDYHEPFLGGAAVFLGLEHAGRSFLADANSDLIEVYQCIRDDYESVADLLLRHVNTA